MAADIQTDVERQTHAEAGTAFRSEDWLEPVKSFVKEHATELAVGAVGTAAVVAASRLGLGAPMATAVRSAAGYIEELGVTRFGMQPWRSARTFMFDLDRTLIDTDKAFGAYHSTLRNELLSRSGLSPSLLDAG